MANFEDMISRIVAAAVEKAVADALARHMAVPPPEPEAAVLTKAELCKRWKCSPRFVEGKAASGSLKATKIGGRFYVTMAEVQRVEREGAAA